MEGPDLSQFEWRKEAACRGLREEEAIKIFFADSSVREKRDTYSKAREFCSVCPVIVDCLISGLEPDNDVGFWGCMSPNERKSVIKKLYKGADLEDTANEIWQHHWRKGRPVPSPKVWKDWT